ncbi:MAG: hypothetical protein MUC96_15035 [Myxococcaceae bacterium]|jgi:antitoxin (DNA-binding transcriptional repressor) of toxin-antitoxin stability system|nr:hypothetical protein [Myxococcaceae bacterium]
MTSPISLSEARADLSRLVQRAARGAIVPVQVRGRVTAYLVPVGFVKAAKPRRPRRRRLGGSLKLLKPVEDSRAAFLEWLGAR